MSSTVEEIIQVCEALPPDKRLEVADFARFLLARQDDEAWERRVAFPQARPRLDAFPRDAAAEGTNPWIRPACDLARPAEFLAGLCPIERTQPFGRATRLRALCVEP